MTVFVSNFKIEDDITLKCWNIKEDRYISGYDYPKVYRSSFCLHNDLQLSVRNFATFEGRHVSCLYGS